MVTKPKFLILIEALLAGQRVVMPSGHTLLMEDHRLFLVAEHYASVAAHRAGEYSEMLLDAGAYNDINVLMATAEEMSTEEILMLSANTALTKLHRAKTERGLAMRTVLGAAYGTATESDCGDCGGTGFGPGPSRRNGPPICTTCKGTSRQPQPL